MAKENWPPSVHLHKASGQARVKWRGRHYYLGPHGSAESRKRYADLVAEIAGQPRPERPVPGKPTAPTVAEAWKLWAAHASQRYSARGREAVQFDYAAAPLLARHGQTRVDTFGPAALEEVRDEMIRLGWCRRVINRRVIRLRTAWRWLERRGHVPAGSWAALRVVAPLTDADANVPHHAPRHAVGARTLARVARQCPPLVRTMLLIQWYTGCRSSEVREMRAGEIDRRGEVWVYRPTQHKCKWRGHSREIPLGPRAQRRLTPLLAGLQPGDFVFAAAPGACYRDDSYARAVARACERAGVSGFSPYTCRHSHKARVTAALGLDHARSSLGQSSLDVTDRYDAGPDRKQAEDVARRFG